MRIGRRGLSDPEQFELAAAEGRIVVTRNRDDFLRLVVTAFEAGRSSPGALVVPRGLLDHEPASIAHALRCRHERHAEPGGPGCASATSSPDPPLRLFSFRANELHLPRVHYVHLMLDFPRVTALYTP